MYLQESDKFYSENVIIFEVSHFQNQKTVSKYIEGN